MKIYLNPEISCDTPEEFLETYINSGCPTTYNEDGTIQCEEGRDRSVTDLFYLTSTYFPEVTLKEVVKILSRFAIDHPDYIMLHCGWIHKVTLYSGVNRGGFTSQDKDYEEVGLAHAGFNAKGIDGYSTEDYYNMITND